MVKNNIKLLIFIVAYNAEKLIVKTLKRIPSNIFKKYAYEILIIDDGSADNTFIESLKYKLKNKNLNINVLFNPINQGYGGNQKIGYCYAIEKNFDIVLLLHGDGQYAPELIENIIEPLKNGKADIVLGSRMLQNKALSGGMPVYKYIGNKILTLFQNKLLRTNLSEFHSGYRAYTVKALKSIPFQRNTNDFHFDTQIIIQFLLNKKRIKEIPIPTYYGSEICYVNGLKYAYNVVKTTLLSRLHNLYILYQREYDIKSEPDYKPKLGFISSHTLALKAVENNSNVLDIGCNEGYFTKEFKKKNCFIVGIDSLSIKNKNNFNKYIKLNLNETNKLPFIDKFDYVLILDVIEHLDNPEVFLDKIREKSKLKKSKIIITTPNIAFLITRLQLFFGSFNYGKLGILDLSHKRLFTFKSIIKLCESCGFVIKKIKGIPVPFPKAIGKNIFSSFLLNFNKLLIFISKNMFSYQIYIEIEPTPAAKELLNHSLKQSFKRGSEFQNENIKIFDK